MSDTLILFIALIVIWIIFAIVRYFLNFIPLLGPLVGAFLRGYRQRLYNHRYREMLSGFSSLRLDRPLEKTSAFTIYSGSAWE